jgi:uncharacterized protein (TIGR03435 family)
VRFQTYISVILLAAAASAQRPLSFEVASVKPSTQPDWAQGVRSMQTGGPGTPDAGRWTCDHMSLSSLLLTAYKLQSFQLSAPAWTETEHYAVTAKVPAGATRDEFRTMLQNLLTERFQMKLRRETKEVAGYELVVLKDGLKLKESAPLKEGEPEVPPPPTTRPRITLGEDGYPVVPPGLNLAMTLGFRARTQAVRQTVDQLAQFLSSMVGRPVANATGLPGKYDYSIFYIYDGPGSPPMPAPGTTPANPAADPSGPTIFKAIQDQLGLKLEPKKIAVDFLTVERAEKVPVAN